MEKNGIMEALYENYEIVENMGYEVVGVFLQGSQNYHLAYEGSDIDCKAIVVPKFNDFVLGAKEVSTTHILPNNEHIDIKDIRTMFATFKKQNINFVEILFTEFKVMNPKYKALFEPMFANNEMIAHYNNYASLNCMVGMVLEKSKALEHPYPATLEKIKKFGYDPKQLHHIVRLSEFLDRYVDGVLYSDCLVSVSPKVLIDIKKGFAYGTQISLEQARIIANNGVEHTKTVKEEFFKKNPIRIKKDVETIMNDVLLNIIKHSFTTELIGGINE